MKPSLAYLRTRLAVDTAAGTATWIDASKFHRGLTGTPAGSARRSSHTDKRYWYIKVDGVALKRAHVVFLFANGRWPEPQLDHINGESTDDRIANLREVTPTQNAWNHKRRAKTTDLPMGVRMTASGRYEARIAKNKKKMQVGVFDTPEAASDAYQQARKEHFGAYA